MMEVEKFDKKKRIRLLRYKIQYAKKKVAELEEALRKEQ